MPNRRWLSTVIAASMLSTWPFVLTVAFPDYDTSLLPGLHSTLLAAACIILIAAIDNKTSKLLATIWIAFYFIGTANAISSSLILRSYYSNLDLETPGKIHLVGCLALICGILLHQHLSRWNTQIITLCDRNCFKFPSPFTRLIFYLFPPAWLASMYFSVGYLPILTGDSIEAEMYDTSYGPLYNYSFLLAPISLAIYEELKHKNRSGLGLLLFLIIVTISLADGKRAIALTSFFGLFLLVLTDSGEGTSKRVAAGLVTAAATYVLIQIVRTGGDTSRIESDSLAYFMKIGVEYRDFSFTTNYLSPHQMIGYDWVSSSVGSFLNGKLLAALGYSKEALVSHGSAQVWSQFFNSSFGIRTGLISELWFEFGVFYIFPLLFFGAIVNYLTTRIYALRNGVVRAIVATMYGLLTLSIVGQSTVLFGVLSILLYLYLFQLGDRIVFAPFVSSKAKIEK